MKEFFINLVIFISFILQKLLSFSTILLRQRMDERVFFETKERWMDDY